MRIIPGIELTHIPPADISRLAQDARELGAQLVIVHGESLVEPVAEGTNHATIEAQIDILAHPGLITDEDVQLAALKRIYLEISTRKGHSLANGHVAKVAGKYHAPLVINTDAHAPGDLVSILQAGSIAAGAGLNERERRAMFRNAEELLEKITCL